MLIGLATVRIISKFTIDHEYKLAHSSVPIYFGSTAVSHP